MRREPKSVPKTWLKLAIAGALFVVVRADFASAQTARVKLAHHVPQRAIAAAEDLGRVSGSQPIQLVVPLKLRDAAGLQDLIRRQTTPGDPFYGKYLTPEQFTSRYAATDADVQTVVTELEAEGFTVAKVHPNHALIEISAKASRVESALGVEFHRYRASDGRTVRASTQEPSVSAKIAPLIEGVVGLDTFAKKGAHASRLRQASAPHANFGSGPSGGLMPNEVKKAYGLSGVSLNGSGQSIAFFEFDGFISADISAYAARVGLAVPPISTVLLDGFNGQASLPTSQDQDPGSIEVELDMEVALGIMPGAAKFIVYESDQGTGAESSFESLWLAMWSRIASDNSASVVTVSWYIDTLEANVASSTINSENTLLQQLASQGRSVFAAAGDSGAYFSPAASSISVADPSDQPYLTSVGGTHLTLASDGSYASETSWATPESNSVSLTGGGGGISSTWPMPSYQTGLGTTANLGSSSYRMVPDVSLAGDSTTGYAIYYNQAWYEVGGTSAAAPLWAAFTALVNEQRAASGLANIGFLNTSIYQIAKSALYSATFNDIADGSTNFKYPAVSGYDLTTGWGSFKGAALISALANPVLPPDPPTALVLIGVGK